MKNEDKIFLELLEILNDCSILLDTEIYFFEEGVQYRLIR